MTLTLARAGVLLICAWIVWLHTETRSGFIPRYPEWKRAGAAATLVECERKAEDIITTAFTDAMTAGESVLFQHHNNSISTGAYRLSAVCAREGHQPGVDR